MWEDEAEEARRRRILWGAGTAVAVILAAGAWYAYRARLGNESSPVPAAAVPVAAPLPSPATDVPIAHPMPSAEGAGATALPALNDSDTLVLESLSGVIGAPAAAQFLVTQNLVRHIVATVDNLPRRRVAVELRPVKPTPGTPATSTQGGLVTLGEDNFARYAPLMSVVQACDMRSLAQAYQRLYPLFQQAYEDLGYPGKYFNDRLVEVIDHLLETPEVSAPIQVVQPKVFFQYADPQLEERSAGQKLLLRMGTANERIIKGKLRELRAQIVKKT
ncbi:MAG: DUF3014 domain-containing protein [Proteobacteria bacterium]|nr:DUF3014 domain-containing protein [Pseudomonadota bacterium]